MGKRLRRRSTAVAAVAALAFLPAACGDDEDEATVPEDAQQQIDEAQEQSEDLRQQGEELEEQIQEDVQKELDKAQPPGE